MPKKLLSSTRPAEYRPAELPSPGLTVGEKIIDTVRRIIHLEEEKGKSTWVLGVRDGSIEGKVKVKRHEDREKVTIFFPE